MPVFLLRPLKTSQDGVFQGRLINSLNTKNNVYNFVKGCKGCINIKTSIEHFYPTYDGKVVLIGIYSIEEKEINVFSERFMLSKNIQLDGYDHSVKRMSELLNDLSEQIIRNAVKRVIKKEVIGAY